MMQIPTLRQHLVVQIHVSDLAEAISSIVKLRLDPVTAPLVGNEEGNLLAALASLQFLCSEIREVNDNHSEAHHAGIEALVQCEMKESV